MKQIYIIISMTGTVMSRIIRGYMKDEFAHVSISLDRELNEMYSFGRLNPYIAFFGGFVHEYIDKGTFKRFYKTKAKIYSLDVEDEQYEALKKQILKFEKEKKKYKFNILGMLLVGFNIRRKKENYFYCAEFVKHILEEANIHFDLPELVRPENFRDLLGSKEIYSGLLREYKA